MEPNGFMVHLWVGAPYVYRSDPRFRYISSVQSDHCFYDASIRVLIRACGRVVGVYVHVFDFVRGGGTCRPISFALVGALTPVNRGPIPCVSSDQVASPSCSCIHRLLISWPLAVALASSGSGSIFPRTTAVWGEDADEQSSEPRVVVRHRHEVNRPVQLYAGFLFLQRTVRVHEYGYSTLLLIRRRPK